MNLMYSTAVKTEIEVKFPIPLKFAFSNGWKSAEKFYTNVYLPDLLSQIQASLWLKG